MTIELIRDLSDTSGYWAAVWTMCVMPDVHVICDAPIGCFNLVGTAVPDYTDSIPHIENLTPSVMTEQEVGGSGTAGAVQRTIEGLRSTGALDNKHLIVVSTAESEMIGADHGALVGQFHPGATFYYSNSLAEDEWTGRDRVLRWLWDQYGAPQPAVAMEPGTVNIIGPTYGCFNAPSDLHEIIRLIEGAGGTINMVYPYRAQLGDTPKLARAAVNVQLYREFGASLAEQLGCPTLFAPVGLQATTDFIRELGRLLGTQDQAERFIAHEKRTTLQALWDLWRGPQSDWFATMDVGIVAGRSHADGLAAFLGEELGLRIDFVVGRPRRPDEQDNDAIRRKLHKRAPMVVFGSINEKIYLSEAGTRANTQFIAAGFPGPAVRRSVGTPFMGYSGTVHVVQELVNGLYETLFNYLPVDGAYAAQRAGNAPVPERQATNMRWSAEARAQLDAALEQLPYIPRISASRELQSKVETLAQQRGASEVTPELVSETLGARSSAV